MVNGCTDVVILVAFCAGANRVRWYNFPAGRCYCVNTVHERNIHERHVLKCVVHQKLLYVQLLLTVLVL